jgi:hypothetical protein
VWEAADLTFDEPGNGSRSELRDWREALHWSVRRQTWLLGTTLVVGLTALGVIFGLLARR